MQGKFIYTIDVHHQWSMYRLAYCGPIHFCEHTFSGEQPVADFTLLFEWCIEAVLFLPLLSQIVIPAKLPIT